MRGVCERGVLGCGTWEGWERGVGGVCERGVRGECESGVRGVGCVIGV